MLINSKWLLPLPQGILFIRSSHRVPFFVYHICHRKQRFLSLENNYWYVLMTKRECVYCADKKGSLNEITRNAKLMQQGSFIDVYLTL